MKYIFFSLIFLMCGFTAFKLAAQTHLQRNYFSFTSQQQPLKMAYVYEKPAGKSKGTVVLLHGKNFSSVYWQTTIQYFNKQGYAVVAPEQVGFGKSSQPSSYQYSFQQLAANTKALLDSLNISECIILGHSMGGMLALRFALMYPAMCTQLILEDPIGLEDWKVKVPYSTVDEQYTIELKKTRQDLKEYMTKNYFHGEWKNQYELLLDESAKFFNRKDFAACAKNMALTTDMIFTQPVCYEFANLKLPVVLIIGKKDKTAIGKERVNAQTAEQLGNYAELGKKTAALIPNCRLIELEGLGHIPHIEDLTAFTKALDSALKE